MNNFHGFVSKLLGYWLVLYALLVLPGLLKGLAIFVLADFTMPAKHYFDIINSIYLGGLWMVPTAFLIVSWYLSGPAKKAFPQQ